jgi:exopolyphosphatase/guanosine-5'-triphosphate,3'-diphosphate pyrophosphatase
VNELSVRERSVLRLVRACGADEAHARHVARLALELFDSSRDAGFHALGDEERELLEHTALLHDVGAFISYPDHHVHSAYLIANTDLLGFDQREIAVMAATALFHRKATPGARVPAYARLDAPDRKTVGTLANLLRLAERLDRSHGAIVRHARLVADGRRALTLHLVTKGPAQLELWGLENRRAAIEKALVRRLTIEVEVVAGGDQAAAGDANVAAGGDEAAAGDANVAAGDDDVAPGDAKAAAGGGEAPPGDGDAATARRRPSPDAG